VISKQMGRFPCEGLTLGSALVFSQLRADGHRLLLTEAWSQDVMRLHDIGPACSQRAGGASSCRQIKRPCLGWGRNLRRASAKAGPPHHTLLYYVARFLASLSIGGALRKTKRSANRFLMPPCFVSNAFLLVS